MVPKNTHNRAAQFNAGAESKGPLESIPMVICCYLDPYVPLSRYSCYLACAIILRINLITTEIM